MKKKKRKPASTSTGFFVICLLLVAAFASGWWFWHRIYSPSPRFNYLLITVNQEPRKILSGETVSLHPKDRVQILKLSSNIPFNLGIRLVSKGFDVNSLRFEEMDLSTLLPKRNIFDHYSFYILIKYRNEELGHIQWEIMPYAEDWLEKVDRTIDTAKRVALLEQAARLLPENTTIVRRLLDEYESQKLWRQAALMLENMAEKKSDREILNELLDVYTAMHREDGVISALKRMVKLEQDDLETRRRLGEAYEKKGDLKSAVIQYEAVLKRVKQRDIKAELYKHVGYLCTQIGYLKKAISNYLKAADLDRKDANVYYNLSYLYDKINQKDKADIYLNKAVRLKAGDLKGRLRLAQGMIDKGEAEKAEKYLKEVLSKKPDSLQALLLMARLMEEKGKKEGLINVYKRILSLDPKNETVNYNLAGLEYDVGDLDESLKRFKTYLKSHPEDAEVHRVVFDIYKRRNNAEEAFKEARTLVKLLPKEIDSYYYIFDYLNKRDDYGKIISFMKKGLEANPGHVEFREYLVAAYLNIGKETLAMKQMSEILKVRPQDTALMMDLAKLKEKHGQLNGALDIYRRVIEISPDNEKAEDAYLRLRLKGLKEMRQ